MYIYMGMVVLEILRRRGEEWRNLKVMLLILSSPRRKTSMSILRVCLSAQTRLLMMRDEPEKRHILLSSTKYIMKGKGC